MSGNLETLNIGDKPPISAGIDPALIGGDGLEGHNIELQHRIERAVEVLNDSGYTDAFKVAIAFWILKGEAERVGH